jgi:histidine triad (HIT) family protein
MLDASCIFCKIIQGTIKSPVVYENEHVLVINDIAPKAPIHYLIMPKKHIATLIDLTMADKEMAWHMLLAARELGSKAPSKAFNLISNNGAAAGQSVGHLHFHLLSGKNLYEGGLSL